MIDHTYKCILIHIPRCAGTSMEVDINGQNWWNTPGGDKTKHLIASTAKKIYAEYWNDYFKFSFVRNPWDRMVSMAKYPSYGVKLSKGDINLGGYFKRFSPIEVDTRSESGKDKFKPIKNAVYLNILNEELDFIGKFENLQEDWAKVCKFIGKKNCSLINDKKHRSNHNHYTTYYNDKTREIVQRAYAEDIKRFGYKYK